MIYFYLFNYYLTMSDLSTVFISNMEMQLMEYDAKKTILKKIYKNLLIENASYEILISAIILYNEYINEENIIKTILRLYIQ